MLISYIQSIMMIILEVICCKIFFESFAEKLVTAVLKKNY